MRTSTYRIRIEYDEQVRGELRCFQFEQTYDAIAHWDAVRQGLDYFDALTLNSGVGWGREVRRIEVERLGRKRRTTSHALEF